METYGNILIVLNQITGIIGTVIVLGFWILGIFGIRKKKGESLDNFPPKKKFAVVVAAHNEKDVIRETLETLKLSNYPQELLDIFLIADNCTDNTAEIGRECGVRVYERFNDELVGKGFALNWMFEQIWELNEGHDAVCVLDADNLVDVNFFAQMNMSLCKGHKIVQGYLDCKNPEDSWVSAGNSIGFYITNRMQQLAKYQVGGSAGIGGTGFVVESELLKEIGWDSYCLTEDLEFQIKLVLKGMKVAWNHDAVFYDEKPVKLKASIKQRTRWMQGISDCMMRFTPKLFKFAFKNKSFVALDLIGYLMQGFALCLIMIVSLITMASELVFGFVVGPEHFLIFLSYVLGLELFMLLYLVVIIIEGKFTWRILGYLLVMPVYLYTWVPPIIKGFIKRNERVWDHTIHNRSLKLEDMK